MKWITKRKQLKYIGQVVGLVVWGLRDLGDLSSSELFIMRYKWKRSFQGDLLEVTIRYVNQYYDVIP